MMSIEIDLRFSRELGESLRHASECRFDADRSQAWDTSQPREPD